MRIGFDARYVDDRYHGVGRFAYQTLEALTRLYSNDRFVVYYNPNRPSTRLDLVSLLGRPNVEARAFAHDLYAPLEQALLASALASARLGIHYVPYFPAPLLAPVRIVVTVHDLILDHERRYHSGRWVRYYYRPMMHLATRRAVRIVAVSRATARDLHALYHVSLDKIAVVPEAADSQFRPVTDASALAAVRERYRLPARFILAVGVRRPHKNLATLVEAFALSRDAIPHALVLVGEAHARYSDDVPGAVARLGLADRVLELGHVPDADLPAVYSLADLFALPSLDEGFGLPALEAMACGAPVVASNTSSIPEVVGEAGLLADPRDPGDLARAIIRAVTDRDLNERLRRLGLARAAEFDWDSTARQLRVVFASAVGEHIGERGAEA